MQMNLNMWQRGMKETISNHDKHKTMTCLLYIQKNSSKEKNMFPPNMGVKVSTMVNAAETTEVEIKDTSICLIVSSESF